MVSAVDRKSATVRKRGSFLMSLNSFLGEARGQGTAGLSASRRDDSNERDDADHRAPSRVGPAKCVCAATVLLLCLAACQGVVFHQAKNPDRGARLLPPTGLTFSVSRQSLHLKWDPRDSKDEADYIVYRSTHANQRGEKVATTKASSVDLKLPSEENATYYCVTASLNGSAESECSNQVAVTPKATPDADLSGHL